MVGLIAPDTPELLPSYDYLESVIVMDLSIIIHHRCGTTSHPVLYLEDPSFQQTPIQSRPDIVPLDARDRDAWVLTQVSLTPEGQTDSAYVGCRMLEEGDHDDRDKDAASRL